MKRPWAVFAFCMTLAAQDAPPTSKAPVLNGAITGIVRDKNTGKALANYTVSTYAGATWVANTILMDSSTKEVKSTTDESGHYSLPNLPGAPYRIAARDSRSFGSEVTKHVIMSGHDLEINFDVVVNGLIKGKVLDENKEPIPGITVTLVSREYYLGSAGYFFRSASRPTNDRGEYIIDSVPAGQPYYLMAELRRRQMPAHSDAPLNPRLRRRVPMRTWYLNSPAKEGAAQVTLRPSETREDVDIEMKKSPAYCAEGTLLTATGGPGALSFNLEAQQPSSGTHEGGGMYIVSGFGTTGSDGSFRFCDLYPGSYRLEASQSKGDQLFGSAIVNITDEDVKGLKVAALPGQTVSGEVILDGPVPLTPLPVQVRISLVPMLRTQRPGEHLFVKADIPGPFNMQGIMPDDFQLRTLVNSPGLYIRDVLWNGGSVRYQPVRMGSSGGSGLRVLVGQDGATLGAVVTTKDGNPAPDIRVVAFPAEITSEGMLAAAMISGQTDQNGNFTSETLAPGKYYVGAVDGAIDYTAGTIGRLWRSRSRFTEIDLSPNVNAQATLEPVQLAQ
jgi:hypothetical protein